jgi:hypothetical protein
MEYKLTLLSMGGSEVPGPELFWMGQWDNWFRLQFQVGLIQGNGITALVNTGPAKDLGPMNEGWVAFLGERVKFARQEGEYILDQLAKHNVKPEDVTHIFLTPLQLYSVSNVLEFPNAKIHISKRGWIHFHTTHQHPHDGRDTSLPPHILAELVGKAWDRVVLLEDEETIAPGLRTWWSGGHHRASIAVEVDTKAGTAVLSDTFFVMENVVNNHPIGITENMYECMDAHARALKSPIVIPLYDPKNFDRFKNGVVA